jgi:type IV secretion system protein VirB2
MAPNPLTSNILHSNRTRIGMFMCLAVFLALMLPSVAFGQDNSGDTITTTCGFASDINKILNALSIIVVTVAIVFSGYQIAFAHKRIAEVAPVLIGAILIGAASQIANMFLKNSTSTSGATACSNTGILTHALNHYAAIVHFLAHYA